MKHEEKERETWEIEGQSGGEVTDNLFRGSTGIPRFLPLVLLLGVARS
jgi:hypothetical protein